MSASGPIRMRVGFDMVPARLSQSGVGRYPAQLLRVLTRSAAVEMNPLAISPRRPRTPVQRLLQGMFRESVYYPWWLSHQARASGCELVHCPSALAPAVSDPPFILTLHDVLPLRRPEWFPGVIVAHARWFLMRRAAAAARIITGSEHSRDEIVELLDVPVERVAVTPYGVSSRFRPSAPDPATLRRRYGIPGRYVLCVGTLEPRKNLATALRAFGAAVGDRDDCALVVVGARGWKNEAFEQARHRTGTRIIETGHVADDDLVDLYSAATCFLYPSLDEGFGFPPLEAMACGTPVIASDRASLPEVVGDAGLVVDALDVDALAGALRRVLDDPALAADLRSRGLARASAYTWEKTASATIEVYRAAIAQAAASGGA